MKSICKILFLSCSLFIGLSSLNAQQKQKPNVLFIAIDDLKPILGCYGDEIVKTPNIDRLAKMGTVFLSNYCQQAVCGPTRASLMTGKRPDYTKVWDLKTRMRDINPDILSIPQYFASQGYSTQGIGKVYDSRCVDKELDKPSWTVPYYKTDESYYAPNYGDANTLARIVESVVRNCVGGTLKRIDATSAPTRVNTDGIEEQRYLTFNVVVMAQDK
jgi:arylsulfatase A-like enzyme